MRRLVVLVLVVGAVAGVWLLRGELAALWQAVGGRGVAVVASAELAARAEGKLARLGTLGGPERVALYEAELQSLLEYHMAPTLPAYILAPHIDLHEGRVRVKARVPVGEVRGLRGVPGSREFIELLPDTTDVEAVGQIIPLGGGRVALSVEEVSAARIPLPQRVIPALLTGAGRVSEPGLPAEAFPIDLPGGASSAFVHHDSLVVLGSLGPRSPR